MDRYLQLIANACGNNPDNLFAVSASTARRWGYTPEELRDPEVSIAFMTYRLNRFKAMLGIEDWDHVVDAYIMHIYDPVRPIGMVPDVGAPMREALSRRLIGL